MAYFHGNTQRRLVLCTLEDIPDNCVTKTRYTEIRCIKSIQTNCPPNHNVESTNLRSSRATHILLRKISTPPVATLWRTPGPDHDRRHRSEEHTSELQSR